MTTPHYPQGCPAGSEVRGSAVVPAAWSPRDNAWIVNFNNGNSNDDHQDNEYHVLLSRPRECHVEPSLRTLHAAWRRARRRKTPSANQLAFETRWIDELLELEAALERGTWRRRPSTCFIAGGDKAREIHAPDFADRVVHHWVVPPLEARFEPTFIHDSYSNRRGKGTHAAVRRLERFVRQVHSGQGGGGYLKLDIRNCFNSVHRPTLLAQLLQRIERDGLPDSVRRTVLALLGDPFHPRARYACTERERSRVPAWKRLENAPRDHGIPIGDLFSQFGINVHLDPFDQFVKHRLRCRRYLRYVDDFVLIHHDRAQLLEWCGQIEYFLSEHLRLALKPHYELRPLTAGIDFLGYVVFPTHTVIRRRVVGHCRARLDAWARKHVRGDRIRAGRAAREALRSTWTSYLGHFRHARHRRLVESFARRYPWLPRVLSSLEA